MAFANILDGTTADAVDVQQLIDAFNGTSGKGQPLDLIQLDADRYYLAVKNLHANSKCAQFFKSDGTLLFQVASGGVLASIAGAAAEALAPAASPTFSGIVTMGGSVIETRAANTASAAGAQTLPAGVQIPITGTNTITSIVAGTAGRRVTLEFASAGCVVKAAALSGASGDYISTAGGTLSLESDGTNWHERSRAGHVVPGARYRLSAATTSIVSGAERTVTWTATDFNYGMTAASTAAPVPGVLGRWMVSGEINLDWTSAPPCTAFLLKNGSDYLQLFGLNPDNSTTTDGGLSFCRVFEVTSLTDTYGLGLTTDNTINLIGGASKTSLEFTYLGR